MLREREKKKNLHAMKLITLHNQYMERGGGAIFTELNPVGELNNRKYNSVNKVTRETTCTRKR